MLTEGRSFLHLKNLWTNIGNAFIDLGILVLWEKLLGSPLEAFPCSHMRLPPEFILTTIDRTRWASDLLPARAANKLRLFFHDPERSVLLHYDTIVPFGSTPDYVTVSGMILTRRFMLIYKRWLERLSAKGSKILFIGVGGAKYDEREVEAVEKVLREIKPYLIVARDTYAYNYYSHLFEHAYPGIDNAFFLREKFYRQDVEKRYTVFVFDSTPPPDDLKPNFTVVRAYHSFYASIKPGKVLEEKSYPVFVSDNPFDYIQLYNMAGEVYSDRVHACIAGVTFGAKCSLYWSSDKRYTLLDSVAVKRNGVYTLDKGKYEAKTGKEISFLREVLL